MRNLILYLACLLSPFMLWAEGDTYKIVGSDLMSDVLSQPLKDFAERSPFDLAVDMYGSKPALAQLRSGLADIGIVAIPEGEALPEDEFKVIPLAYQIAVFVINNENPLSEISLPEILGIYATTSDVNYSRWSDIGLTGSWTNRPIQVIAYDRPGSVVFELFKYKALNRAPLKPSVFLTSKKSEIVELMVGDSSSLAVVDALPDHGMLKALSISSGKPGDFAFGPTSENVYYGDYPVRLPIYLIFKADREAEIKETLFYLLGEEASEVFDREGFMPLPGNVRERTVLELKRSILALDNP